MGPAIGEQSLTYCTWRNDRLVLHSDMFVELTKIANRLQNRGNEFTFDIANYYHELHSCSILESLFQSKVFVLDCLNKKEVLIIVAVPCTIN